MFDVTDEIDQRYRDLVASCWSIFANEDAAAARISMMFEVYPELALRKLRERPEFFGPLRDDKVTLVAEDISLRSSTALEIQMRVRDFRRAIEEQVAEVDRDTEEKRRDRKRSRDRDR